MDAQLARWMSALGMGLLLTCSALSQSASSPAYLIVNGLLYTWSPAEEAIRPFAGCDLGTQRALTLALSPTGTHLALNLVPEEIYFGGYAPSPTGDVFLCDLQTGAMTRLTEVDLMRISVSERGVWSPDGSRLAWGMAKQNTADIVAFAYDLTIQQSAPFVVDTPLDMGCGVGPFPPTFDWGNAGIVVGYFIPRTTGDLCASMAVGLYVYDGGGARIADIPLTAPDEYAGVAYVAWDDENPGQILYRLDMGMNFARVHLDGSPAGAAPAVQQYVAGVPTSPSITTLIDAQGFPALRFQLPGTSTSDVIEQDGSVDWRVAFSADGSTALVSVYASFYAVRDGRFSLLDASAVIPLPAHVENRFRNVDIAWAPLATRPTSEAALTHAICPTVKALYYGEANDLARVIPGMGANNVRLAPTRSAEQLGQLAERATVEVIPFARACSGGIRWVLVRLGDGRFGWTAESQGSTYYLEPAR